MMKGIFRILMFGLLLAPGLQPARAGCFGREILLPAVSPEIAGPGRAERSPPNLVLILADDLGNRSLSCFGGAHPSCWLKRVNAEVGKPDREPYKLIWARGLRYKLYNDGRFYDLQKELAEEHRIAPGAGDASSEAARVKLKTALERCRK